MRSACVIILSGLVLSLWMADTAEAQSWTHPNLVDYDTQNDDYSTLWDQTLRDDDKALAEQLRQVHEIWSAGTTAKRELALSMLREIVQDSGNLEARYLEGSWAQSLSQWDQCAKTFSAIYEVEPSFESKTEIKERGLDNHLATCFLESNQYEKAIKHLRRVTALGRHSVPTMKIGLAYMALGRVGEATEFLTGLASSDARYALAVALDRAGRHTDSERALAAASSRDREFYKLRSINTHFFPAYDRDYYLGLALASQHKNNIALYHFRRFQEQASESPWLATAKRHSARLQRLLAVAPIGGKLVTKGAASWNRAELLKAIGRQSASLRKCTKNSPIYLAKVTLSAVVGGSQQATVAAEGVDSKIHQKVTQCLQASASRIRLPRLTGSRGTHASAVFSLVGAPK